MALSTVLSPILSLVSIVLVILVVIACSKPNLLSDLYFLKVTLTNLNIPSRLGNSTLLRDLSALTGTDWVGKETNAANLGLADGYVVGLLAACGEGNETSPKCSDPRVGFHFNPITDLNLDKTALHGSYPPSLSSALSSYRSISGFLAGAYVVAVILAFLAPLAAIFASRRPALAISSAVGSLIGTFLLMIASITVPITFSKLTSALNLAFSASGINTSFGSKPVILSWIATVLSFAASSILVLRARSSLRNKRGHTPSEPSRLRDLKITTKSIRPVKGPTTASRKTPFSAMLPRMPTFGTPTYTRVERQTQIVETGRRGSGDDDRELLFEADNMPGDVIHEHDHEDEFHDPEGYAHHAPRGIAMQPLAGRATRDADVAYEPYSRTT